MHWLVIVALLLAAACGLLVYLLKRQEWQDSKRRFEEVLAAQEEAGWLASAFAGKADARKTRILHSATQLQTVNLDLRRAGWTSATARSIYFTAVTAGPVVGLIAGGLWGSVLYGSPERIAALGFLGLGFGYLLPPRLLHWQASRRQKAMREEMLPVLHILRMLFDAGLSLEHALRVISEQGRELAPNLAVEIGFALSRINAGQDRGDALEEMAAPLGVAELDDTIAILKQATRYGGSLRESLARFAVLLEDRRMTGLREYVSKLSAKMTVVMVAFMFPALILFLAGPGFLALARALAQHR